MTKVPEYNLPRFNSVPLSHQEKTDRLYWRYKKKTPPKDIYKPNRKRTRLIDKALISEQIANRNHISSIKHEE